MSTADEPRSYPAWREALAGREEDAAHAFGYYLMRHCRDQALAKIRDLPASARDAAEVAVDTALHNVCDMLEGFWPLQAGPQHRVDLVLAVRVRDESGAVKETVEISPGRVDLPMGYWLWARERRFR